jgi:sensor histidine kinase YesM
MEAMTLGLIEWYLWALISLLTFRLCLRFPLDRARWRRAVLSLTLAAVVIVPVQILAYTCFHLPIDTYFMRNQPETIQRDFWQGFVGMLKSKFHIGVLTFGLMTIASYTFLFYRRYREEELRAVDLKAQLVNAQLNTLRTQLHPHFLFNTLNAVSALMQEDVEAAEKMLMRLSDMLRMSLRSLSRQKVPLQEELEFVKIYLEIEKVRFSDRLHVDLQVDEAVTGAAVPYMLLQPLVENAIRHGITPKRDGGTVRIAARRNGGRLFLEISDDGVGLQSHGGRNDGSGMGLANTRERLGMLYGDVCSFSIGSSEKGVSVKIELPFETCSL